MSTQTLSSIAIDLVDQYHAAGKHIVHAYRAGTQRAVGAVNERFASAVNTRRLPLVTEPMKESVIEAQRHVVDFLAYGMGLPASGADITLDQVSRRVANGIERVTSATSQVENKFAAQALDKMNAIALPVARVSLKLATAVAEGTKRLSERVIGAEETALALAEPVQAPRKAAKTPARKATTRRTRAA